MTTILVTGGAGYIGSHACKALAKAGFTPVVYDNLVRGNDWAVKWGPLEIGDIADRARLDAVIAEYKPAATIHFAGYAYVGESVADPGKYYRNNVHGALNLLEALCDHRRGPIVFSSTCATYGVPETTPILESFPQVPINPYGRGKLIVEKMLSDFERAHAQRFAILRYFNAAGADADGEIGEDHAPETRLIPLAIRATLGAGPALSIFGDDYQTPDGTCVRDYVHVSDLARAHVAAVGDLLNGGSSFAVNLGTGRGQSVFEVVNAVSKVAGKDVPYVVSPRRPGDPAVLVADVAAAKARLGFEADYRDIEAIVETAWDWHATRRPKITTG